VRACGFQLRHEDAQLVAGRRDGRPDGGGPVADDRALPASRAQTAHAQLVQLARH
jgi:hypothetical protein